MPEWLWNYWTSPEEAQNPFRIITGLVWCDCLSAWLLQLKQDLLNREWERYLSDSNAAKWFCCFELMEKTPDHTVFCKVRKKIGTKKVSQIWHCLQNTLNTLRQARAKKREEGGIQLIEACEKAFMFFDMGKESLDGVACFIALSIWHTGAEGSLTSGVWG